MKTVASHLIPEFAPRADPEAVVHVPNLRVTVLTGRIMRIEYSPADSFEDRPSQPFWYRSQVVPPFTVSQEGGQLVVETDHLLLFYTLGTVPAAETLSVTLKSSGGVWHYGDPDTGNLMGTYRTLDTIDGKVPLEKGLLSRSGWAVVDDSKTLVFTDDGWLTPREAPAGQLDLYFFGYGRAFRAALRDYRKLAGAVPVLPRWALGNWWSRYWKYTDEMLRRVILDFEAHEIPLSVFIIDMDWHITDTGNTSSGWTGYTWNREYFPDPTATIDFIHEHGLKTALNLHPADGVHPHEEIYREFAQRVGADPDSAEPVRFDLADRKFTAAYFDLLHHPEEARGVDFWWIDWQQGTLSGMPGLDPLWWLNHLHFYDLSRPQGGGRPEKRPFIFSRWGGLGNHRYPIGFSGDTIITWDSLAFQPTFTSTAANVGYGWWSHDIGGHYGGIKDAELYTRWVQYGMLSPILRLHSTANAQLERRPFGWDAETLRLTRHAMQFRHRLIPYLYTMSWRDHAAGEAPFRPMYHDFPEEEAAYLCPDQYMFGSELIAAPYVQPRDPETGHARQVAWLPEEAWHFFSGRHYPAGWHALHGTLDDVPLFAKPGAIVPLCEPDDWRAPGTLEIHVFPGASNTFDLYEDDGETNRYAGGDYCLTRFESEWSDRGLAFRVFASDEPRTYTLKFRAVSEPANITATLNGEPCPLAVDYDAAAQTLVVSPPDLGSEDRLEILLTDVQVVRAGHEDTVRVLQSMVADFKIDNTGKQVLYSSIPEIVADPKRLTAFRVLLSDRQIQALLEVLLEAGVHLVGHVNEPVLLLWNRKADPSITYELSIENHRYWLGSKRFQVEKERVPPYKGYVISRDFNDVKWKLLLKYGDLLFVSA